MKKNISSILFLICRHEYKTTLICSVHNLFWGRAITLFPIIADASNIVSEPQRRLSSVAFQKRKTKTKQFQNKANTFLENHTYHVGYILFSTLHSEKFGRKKCKSLFRRTWVFPHIGYFLENGSTANTVKVLFTLFLKVLISISPHM